MANSTHRVEVVPIKLEPHPNADTLSVVRVFDHYSVVVRTADFEGKSIAAFIPPDSVVPDTPEYSFLNGSRRIRAKKFRGVQSQGLMVTAPEGAAIGDDVAVRLGITHYDPPINYGAGEMEQNPPIPGEHYDIENWFRYGSLIPEGTPVELTEKIHGSNFRVTYQQDRLWVGSRNNYWKPSNSSLYWQAVKFNPWIEYIARANPGMVVYAEVFGNVQSLKYGANKGTPHMLRVFDIFHAGRYLDAEHRYRIVGPKENHAPILYSGPYSAEVIMQHIAGPSTIPGADHYREGVVIKPLTEMWSPEIGRLVLKAVSPEYLEKVKS